MMTIERSNGSGEHAPTDSGKTRSLRRGSRLRRFAASVLLILVVTACTPAEIEGSLNRIASSFEEGGLERGLSEAIFVVEFAIPVVGMRLGSAFGP